MNGVVQSKPGEEVGHPLNHDGAPRADQFASAACRNPARDQRDNQQAGAHHRICDACRSARSERAATEARGWRSRRRPADRDADDRQPCLPGSSPCAGLRRAWRQAPGGCRSRGCAGRPHTRARRRDRSPPAASPCRRTTRSGRDTAAAARPRATTLLHRATARHRHVGIEILHSARIGCTSDDGSPFRALATTSSLIGPLRMRQIQGRRDAAGGPVVAHVGDDADHRAAGPGAAQAKPRADLEVMAERILVGPHPLRQPVWFSIATGCEPSRSAGVKPGPSRPRMPIVLK